MSDKTFKVTHLFLGSGILHVQGTSVGVKERLKEKAPNAEGWVDFVTIDDDGTATDVMVNAAAIAMVGGDHDFAGAKAMLNEGILGSLDLDQMHTVKL